MERFRGGDSSPVSSLPRLPLLPWTWHQHRALPVLAGTKGYPSRASAAHEVATRGQQASEVRRRKGPQKP